MYLRLSSHHSGLGSPLDPLLHVYSTTVFHYDAVLTHSLPLSKKLQLLLFGYCAQPCCFTPDSFSTSSGLIATSEYCFPHQAPCLQLAVGTLMSLPIIVQAAQTNILPAG